jgi:hypothetical protein
MQRADSSGSRGSASAQYYTIIEYAHVQHCTLVVVTYIPSTPHKVIHQTVVCNSALRIDEDVSRCISNHFSSMPRSIPDDSHRAFLSLPSDPTWLPQAREAEEQAIRKVLPVWLIPALRRIARIDVFATHALYADLMWCEHRYFSEAAQRVHPPSSHAQLPDSLSLRSPPSARTLSSAYPST